MQTVVKPDQGRIAFEHFESDSPGESLFRIVFMLGDPPNQYQIIRYYDDQRRAFRLLNDIRNSPNKKLVEYKKYRIEIGR